MEILKNAFGILLLIIMIGMASKFFGENGAIDCYKTLSILEQDYNYIKYPGLSCREQVGRMMGMFGDCQLTESNIDSVIENPYNTDAWEIYCD